MMAEKARELAVRFTGSETVCLRDSSGITGPTIVGDVIYPDSGEVLTHYEDETLEIFLAHQARYSVGNYVLVDPDNQRVVTSPGYPGGYVAERNGGTDITTVLSPLLEDTPPKFDKQILEQYFMRDLLEFPMYRTVFQDIDRLPPAYVVEYNEGQGQRRYGYLNRALSQNPPSSFRAAFNETMERIAADARQRNRSVVVLFSGGVDSLCLLIGARKFLNDDQIRVVTCDYGNPQDGPVLARRLTDSLGGEITVQTDEDGYWPPREPEIITNIEEAMDRDLFVKVMAPHLALSNRLCSVDDIVLSGMNFGGWIRGRHAGEREPYPSGFPPDQFLKYVLSTSPPLRQLQSEFTRTNQYINNRSIRRCYQTVHKQFSAGTGIDFDTSLRGYLYGMLKTGFPNLRERDDWPSNLYDPNPDIDRFFAEVTNRRDDQAVTQFYYYWFNQNGHKVLSSPTPSGSYCNLPVMHGPLASYYLDKGCPWYHILSPKRPYYQYIKKETGKRFHELTGLSISQFRELTEYSQDWKEHFTTQNRTFLDPDSSTVLERTDDNHRIREMYAQAEERATESESRFGTSDVGAFYRIINIERLMSP